MSPDLSLVALVGLAITSVFLIAQGAAAAIVLSRIIKGARRNAPLLPQKPQPQNLGKVTVVVPTLNEVDRIQPCLEGLTRQSYEVREILFVDSQSQDGTREKIASYQPPDPRIQLLSDPPLPSDWVGRPWALHHGFLSMNPASEWFLGIDADTQPQPGLVASVLQAAETGGYDLISLSPQFILESPGEWWLQPALLMTLLYRFEVAGVDSTNPEKVMANGQCFLCRRSVLAAVGGYGSAKGSFCDDVTLARNVAKAGYKVGFFDGAKVIRVRMYEGMAETWTEWGRSLDLKDASTPAQVAWDLWLLTAVQALPLPLTVVLGICVAQGDRLFPLDGLWALNLFLVVVRWAMVLAVSGSYHQWQTLGKSWPFFLSPLADGLAIARLFLSATRKPKSWRGRTYG